MNAWIARYGEWIYRSVLLATVCVGLYLNSRYVTREEFSTIQEHVRALETTLKVMVEANRINDRQDEQLRDHEARLRVVEAVSRVR